MEILGVKLGHAFRLPPSPKSFICFFPMSTSNAVLKRGSAALFGSLSHRQQPRLALHSFSRLIPYHNSAYSSSSPSLLYNIPHLVKSLFDDISHFESNGKMMFFVDELIIVKRLEAQGIPSKHAGAIISAMILFVYKEEMQKQKEHYCSLQHETEEHRVRIEKMISGRFAGDEKIREIRYHGEKMHSIFLASKESELSYVKRETSLVIAKICASDARIKAAADHPEKCLIGSIVFLFGVLFICRWVLSAVGHERA